MTRSIIMIAIACVLISMPMTNASSQIEPEVADSTFAQLAAIFNEVGDSMQVQAMVGSCGVSGHCNYQSCSIPDCPQDQYGYANCLATEHVCDDKHNGLDPTDNDKHPVYDCKTGCTPKAQEPEECLVSNPVGNGCLVDKEAILAATEL